MVDDEHYVMTCYRYIELNPVRAGMVAEPADYRWSSCRANGLGQHDLLVNPHELYLRIARNRSERCALYRELVCGADRQDQYRIGDDALQRREEGGYSLLPDGGRRGWIQCLPLAPNSGALIPNGVALIAQVASNLLEQH